MQFLCCPQHLHLPQGFSFLFVWVPVFHVESLPNMTWIFGCLILFKREVVKADWGLCIYGKELLAGKLQVMWGEECQAFHWGTCTFQCLGAFFSRTVWFPKKRILQSTTEAAVGLAAGLRDRAGEEKGGRNSNSVHVFSHPHLLPTSFQFRFPREENSSLLLGWGGGRGR